MRRFSLFPCFSKSPFGYLHFTACVAVFLFAACETMYNNSIDSLDQAPHLVSAFLSPAIVNTDTINIGSKRKPDDILLIELTVTARVNHTGETPPSVAVSLSSEDQQTPRASSLLFDDGITPDEQAGDSLYSGLIAFRLARSEIGLFLVEIHGETVAGYRSNTHVLPLLIVRLNQPPFLSNLQAPDTVQTSAQSSFLITVEAVDPDGLPDIRSVVRRTPSNLVLQLNDNGTNGDVLADDGVFSETVSLIPPPPPGSYTFTFQALDRSNEESNILTHTIIILP